MTDRIRVYVWQQRGTQHKEGAYFYQEEGRTGQRCPVDFREFCLQVDDYWETRYSEGGYLIEPVFTLPPESPGEPLDKDQQEELKRVLAEDN